ncbi:MULTISPECIES: Maf family protein [unclassified Gilliamella]|uniref:Maf family protein n=1 Tax=unclassified Gilliamella TaxID=2685620 RepID=UPI002269D565|nr:MULTISPECIES: nucleoside triphosphate pyrophosphatase [unclassified Gilliamella]MCX8573735.1 septum formation inhibitor Maf [Gilliamella sp. B3831]MCX8575637.1 septum formation inhibitor Maf [Gilliamella sp. B3815]MCX8589838.1 septum formation inhibitor Maf [Gilliamella sp. B3812]MCX8602739.1 septum formation inhibitor Maf [Gilliamella sp. B3823]MCX8605036.1 septum formation inhibitor Maf [Gilliamella sp. B3825]
MKIILASTSLSRKKVLEKLAIPFECVAPICDETPLSGESAKQLVERLAKLKAQSLVAQYPNSLIIGSDQVGVLDDHIVCKPHTVENARMQLRNSSGKAFYFYTGMTVINTVNGQSTTICEPFKVTFRQLTDAEIDAYILKEMPLQCAGSFKCDELGITLFDKLEGEDINSLVGLPLLKLNKIMITMGYNPLLIS